MVLVLKWLLQRIERRLAVHPVQEQRQMWQGMQPRGDVVRTSTAGTDGRDGVVRCRGTLGRHGWYSNVGTWWRCPTLRNVGQLPQVRTSTAGVADLSISAWTDVMALSDVEARWAVTTGAGVTPSLPRTGRGTYRCGVQTSARTDTMAGLTRCPARCESWGRFVGRCGRLRSDDAGVTKII